MPYNTNKDLPDSVRNHLCSAAQDIYREAFNNAFQEYKNRGKRRSDDSLEVIAHKVAWSAVKKKYTKNKNDEWVEKK